MAISPYASHIILPDVAKPYPRIIDFLAQRFSHIDKAIWLERIREGKVLDEQGRAITLDTPYKAQFKLYYFREVKGEKTIPFSEDIIFINDDLVIADKPPFLPVTPSGDFVNECLLHRLKKRLALPELTPLHRLDRATSGLVMFSVHKAHRALYTEVFRKREIIKNYEAWSYNTHNSHIPQQEWLIENRLEKAKQWFVMQAVLGEINASTYIKLLKQGPNIIKFALKPSTGKQHQLRVHLSDLGFPIVNDGFYPVSKTITEADDFSKPLQLLAKSLHFTDPRSGEEMFFETKQSLALDESLGENFLPEL